MDSKQLKNFKRWLEALGGEELLVGVGMSVGTMDLAISKNWEIMLCFLFVASGENYFGEHSLDVVMKWVYQLSLLTCYLGECK